MARLQKGDEFGRLTVQEYVGPIGGRQAGYRCLCSCGREVIAGGSNLRGGKTTSCGCYWAERCREAAAKRRIIADSPNDPVVAIWRNIVFRCTSKKSTAYPRYGGRGIKVCQRWMKSVKAFIADMGPRPGPEYTVERIDNDGDYKPSNCRWATKREQCRNRPGRNVRLTHAGRTMLLVEWAEETGIPLGTLHARLTAGWDHEKAITTPVRARKHRRRRDTG